MKIKPSFKFPAAGIFNASLGGLVKSLQVVFLPLYAKKAEN